MNKKNILVSGLSIMFLVGLIGFTTSLAAADPWPSVSESPSGQPIELDTGGAGIAVGNLQYNVNMPVYLSPGDSILANATVTNTVPEKDVEGIIVLLNNATSYYTNGTMVPTESQAGDIATQTTALVWVDTHGGTETAPTSGDFVLNATTGMQGYSTWVQNNSPLLQLFDTGPNPSHGITTGTDTMYLPASTTYVVHYILTLSPSAGTAAEGQMLKVGTSINATYPTSSGP